MKQSKIIVICLLLIYFCPMLHSQAQDTIAYRYDAAGNRLSRTIVMSSKTTPASPMEEKPVVYTELFAEIQLKIYPNPTDGLLKVEISNLPEGETAQIRLYAMSGQLITSFNKVSKAVDVNISGQPAGVYVMRIEAGNFRTEWKIIKR